MLWADGLGLDGACCVALQCIPEDVSSHTGLCSVSTCLSPVEENEVLYSVLELFGCRLVCSS